MKNYLIIALLALLLIPAGQPSTVHAVYAVRDSENIAQAVKQAMYQYQQIQLDMQNLSAMDGASAAENMAAIQENLTELAALQQNIQGLMFDYQNFQENWDNLYNTGGVGEDYANQAQQVLQATDQATYDAMRAQGWAVSTMPTTAESINALLAASQNAEGALAAAQAGNQIAAMQAQQMMILQQMIASNNQAQLAYQKEREQQNADAEAVAAELYSGTVTPTKGQGPGFGW